VTVVIDVGCAKYGGDYSIERLLEEFNPQILHGFDPAWQADMFDPPEDLQAVVHVSNEAAWTHDGKVRFTVGGLGGQVTSTGPELPCIDLARVVIEQYSVRYERDKGNDWTRNETGIVLKMDAEGSEYELLDHLIEAGADKLLKLAWIEWHPFGVKNPAMRRKWIEDNIACEITEWRW